MAVVGIAIGGIAVGAVIYDNHSDHSDYSDYDNYSDYSDAAERRRRRIEEKRGEISSQENEVNTYKAESVNDYLKSVSLKKQDGVSVSLSEVKEDGDAKINDAIEQNTKNETAELVKQMENIDKVIDKIDKILEESE